MSDQVDWYLHEGAGPGPGVSFLSLSSGGITYGICAYTNLTLDVASIWPTLEADDFLLMQIAMERTSSGGASLNPIPENWQYIHWGLKPTASVIEPGPNCFWAYRFAKDVESADVLTHSETGGQVCVKVWALRNVNKLCPVDMMWYTAQEYNGTTKLGQLVQATRVHDFGGIQVTSLSCLDGVDNSQTWQFPVMLGPTPDYSIYWTMKDAYNGDAPSGYNAGGVAWTHHLVYFDVVEETMFEEYTKTPLAGSATGGLTRWTELNGSTSWISSTSGQQYRQIFGGATGSLDRSYIKSGITLGPGQYIFCGYPNGRTPQDSAWYVMTVKCEDETGLHWGAYYRGFDCTYRGPIDDSSLTFDYVVSQSVRQDGTPTTGGGNAGHVFSLTQTHVVQFACKLRGQDGTGSSNNTKATYYACVNPTDKSVFTPFHIPRADWWGINRAWVGTRVWAADEGKDGYYGYTFQINKANGPIRTPGFGGTGFTFGHGNPWAKPYPTNWRGGSFDDEGNAMSRCDRWIWPRRYESLGASTWTWGHYYFEVHISEVDNIGYDYDSVGVYLLAPCDSRDGHSLENSEIHLANWVSNGISSASLAVNSLSNTNAYWATGDICGVQVDYANSIINVTRNGAQYGQLSLTAIGKILPFNATVSGYAGTAGKAWRTNCNMTGPFSYKPAGAVAYDWINEVS